MHCITASGQAFEVYMGTLASSAVRSYHENVMFWVLLFIDGGRYLDLDDDKWIVFYMYLQFQNSTLIAHYPHSFQRHDTSYSLVGYATLYPFTCIPFESRYRIR